MKRMLLKILPILIIIITLSSIQQWASITLSSIYISLFIKFFIIYIALKYKIVIKNKIHNYIPYIDIKIIYLYLIWFAFNTLRGIFIADNYWEYKQMMFGVQSLSLPVLVYIFSNPIIVKNVLNYWFKYAIIIFICLIPFISNDIYHFYLGPIFLIGCFLPILPNKWKYISLILLLIMLTTTNGARSQVIKSAIVLLIATGLYLSKYIPIAILKITNLICYIAPIIFLYLGITGTFNIFKGLDPDNEGIITETKVNGVVVNENIAADTRTFIYEEVISSAINNNYVIWGRTPARGNDSKTFGAQNAEELKTGKYERYKNEVCHPNIFTWLGLIGVILYSLIYIRSSYLAIYKSNNIYIKFLGCFIAFRWAYGWVEDINSFDIANITLWMMIAMGISIQFRTMNDDMFKTYIKSLLSMKQMP